MICIVKTVVIIVLGGLYLRVICKNRNESDSQSDESDLHETNTIKEDPVSATDRIKHSIDVAVEMYNFSRTSYFHKEDSRAQMRGFYGLVLAALIWVVFSPTPINSKLCWLASGIVVGFYYLDIQLTDVMQRYVPEIRRDGRTLVKLINLEPSDYPNMKLIYPTERKSEQERKTKRWKRKILRAIEPDGEQFILYFVPLMAFIWFIQEIGQ